ncbi:MAG: hypothetical protein WCI77_02300 [Candidatus Omnitrophota bacterium]
MSWKKSTVLLLLAIIFLNGLMFWAEDGGWVWLICSILIVGILSEGKISKRIREHAGVRKIIAAVLMVLVLIPLVFFGTCLLGLGGWSLRSLFRL